MPPADERPNVVRGDTVTVAEENIRPWNGTVRSVKYSIVSGWWFEVLRDDGMSWAVHSSIVAKTETEGGERPRIEPASTAATP